MMLHEALVATRILPQGQAFAVLILAFVTLFLAVLLITIRGDR